MNPKDFGAATAAIIVALAELVGGPTPGSAQSFLGDLAGDLGTLADGMPDGPAKHAVNETVAAMRARVRAVSS